MRDDKNTPIDAEAAQDILRDAIDSLKEGFALYDENRKLVLFNQRYAEMNKSVSDLLRPGLDWEILMRESARRGVYADAIGDEDRWVTDRLINGVEFIRDYELRESNGMTHLVSVHPTKLGGFVVTRSDITDKKQVELAEREGDLVVRTVLDASSALVVMARIGDGQILYRSPAATDLFGNTKNAREHYVNIEDRADYITQLLAGGEVNDHRMSAINAVGDQIEVSVSGRLAEYKGEEVVVTSIVDLTEQLEADALIRKVLEACPVPVQMTNAETGELLFRSPETVTLFGALENSKSYYVDQAEREAYLKVLGARGSVDNMKVQLKNAKGGAFWGSISSRLIDFKGEKVIVSNTRDMTEELALQEELSNQRELLFQNEKMSALGELLAGVAHELNNPLSVVVGHSLMMQEEISDPVLTARIEKISSAAERCAKIVKTFLAMARQQPTRIEHVDVNSVIQTATDVAAYGSQSEGLTVETRLGRDLPMIAADADQITQVIINLIINAEHAIKASGVGHQVCVSSHLSIDKKSVEVVVEDDGPGVPEKIRARIFEPFFTTKEVGEGTGIGLAFCHRIILSHGGHIRLDGGDYPGSRFRIRLPIVDAPASENSTLSDKSKPTKALRALIVDDEPEVGELTAEIIRREGFHVDFVSSGAVALERLAEETYDIFLSDLNMPDIDGRKIYEKLLCDFPHMLHRTAFITGDTMGVSSQKLLKESKLPHVEKPVAPSEFRTLIDKLLTNEKTED